jgi:hypothetical protein
MKYTFHIVDVFSSTPFGGNQLAVVPNATGISAEGMQKIAREFNFGETTFVLPKNDPANTCRVRIFTRRAELDFAGNPSVGAACALVMKKHVRLSDPIRLILEENIGPVTVDVAQRNRGFHGTLTLSGKIDARTGAASPIDLAAVLSIEPAEVSQVFFAGVRQAIVDHLDERSRLVTDGSTVYKGQSDKHESVDHSKYEWARGDVHTNTLEGFLSIFKRGLVGTYQHMDKKHFDRYCAEFDFRFNNRVALKINDAQRAESLLAAVVGKRLTYETTNIWKCRLPRESRKIERRESSVPIPSSRPDLSRQRRS